MINEIIASELKYTQDLGILVKHFVEPLNNFLYQKKPLIPKKTFDRIFVNIEALHSAQKMFYSKINKKAMNLYNMQKLGELYLDFQHLSSFYTEFIVKYKGDVLIAEEIEKKTAFASFISVNIPNIFWFVYIDSFFLQSKQSSHECKNLPLQSYLIQPIQRLPKMILLFEELLKKTDAKQREHRNILKVIEMVRKLTMDINEKKRSYERDLELIELRESLEEENIYSYPELWSPTLEVIFPECLVSEKVMGVKKNTAKESKITLLICNEIIVARSVKDSTVKWIAQLDKSLLLNSWKEGGLFQKKPQLFDALELEASNGNSADSFILFSHNKTCSYPFVDLSFHVLFCPPSNTKSCQSFPKKKTLFQFLFH